MKYTLKQALKAILLEFQERGLPPITPRAIHFPNLPESVRKAWVLMGMRRSGKTWIVYQHMALRKAEGAPVDSNLYVNFEDDRLEGFELADFQTLLDVYFELYPKAIHEQNLFFCFDEIHIIPGWEKFIRRLLDTEKMQICVTGSSAEMLSKELATTLGGRALSQEVFPYSFSEFLAFHNVQVEENLSYKTQSVIRSLARDYLMYGGFPEVVASPRELHTSLIQGYMDAVVLRDIVKRHRISNVFVLEKFLLQILRQLAAPLSVSKIYQALKSQGFSLGKNSLFQYLQYFEEAYAILTVPFFSLSHRQRQANPKKAYAVDPGIITAYSVKTHFERGARLENAVFMHLRRFFTNICYYRTKERKKEVDFVVTTTLGELLLYQVCVDLQDPQTREREASALYEACEEVGLSHGFIITEDHEESFSRGNVTIECLPFWKWAMSPPTRG